jgi:plastocyanin
MKQGAKLRELAMSTPSMRAGLTVALACAPLSCCWAAPQAFTVLNETGQPLQQAVVAVVAAKGDKANGAGTVVEMGQRNRQFTPSVVAVPVGGAVNFPNYDTVRHHVYSFSPAKKFEIKLYAGTPAAPIVFDKPGTATLGCNIHDGMIGYIHVVDTPYYGVTDAQGRLTLDVPTGEHKVRIWSPAMGEASPPVEFNLKTGPAATYRVKG